MSTFTNLTKHNVTPVNLSKNSVSFSDRLKSGSAWRYNQPTIKYNGPTETSTGLTVYYNSLGIATTYSNLTKH